MVRSSMDRLRWGVLLLGLLVATPFCAWEKGKTVEKGVIDSDTTWDRAIFVKGDVEIAPGVLLTILPGTVVRFARIESEGPENLHETLQNHFARAELIVRGRLIARGTKDRMIRFTSAQGSPRPGDWGAVNFLDSKDNILEYCDIRFADTAVHGHGVQMTVQNCYLHDNGVAIAYNDVPGFRTKTLVSIHRNRITGNGGGILCGRQTQSRIGHNLISSNHLYGVFGKNALSAQVRFNQITGNGKGVILYATRGFSLNHNNLNQNEGYTVSLLEGQIYGVEARENWWGTSDEKKIRDSIWDKEEERELGRVDFSDFAASPIEGVGVQG